MAFLGMKHVVFAPIAGANQDGMPTYGKGFLVGRAMTANQTIESADSPLYADDIVAERMAGFTSGTISVGVDDVALEVQRKWLGSTVKTMEGVEVTVDSGANMSPEGGFGYLRIGQKNNVRFVRAIFLLRTQFSLPSEEAQTKGGGVEWQTPTIEGAIMTVEGTEDYRFTAQFETEADARAWLNKLANVEETQTEPIEG